MSYIYITDYHANVCIKDGRLVIKTEREGQQTIPLEQLEGLVIYGNLSVSTGFFREMLIRGIPTTLLSNTGKFFGVLESTQHKNIERQRQQFRKGDDPDFRLSISKEFVESKINNQIVILKRYNRYIKSEEVESRIGTIRSIKGKIEKINTIPELMGLEGSCARNYFDALSIMTINDFKFSGRNKRPPKDPFNSLLSLGYTLLLYEAYTAITAKGLNPYAGFLHKDKHGHPALASDLIEEWRAVIVDCLVLSILNGAELLKEDFVKEKNNAIFLTRESLKKFIRKFEEKVRTQSAYLDCADSKISFRKAMLLQVEKLCKSIEENNPGLYSGIRLR